VVPGSNTVRLLTKLPIPVPLVVLELTMVGAVVVAQQVPLATMAAPPSEVMFPPEAAVVKVIAVTGTVVRTGIAIVPVVNVRSFP
jgi:hypothetical protein